MNAPRKPRVPVDLQLELFETSLRSHIAYQINRATNNDYWEELDELPAQVRDGICKAVTDALEGFRSLYANVEPIMNLLTHLQILMENLIWVGMNVPYPRDPRWHTTRVIDNAFEAYVRVIYAPLRTEMIMANHNAEVLQRTWRRCVTDPEHPACRRRLLHEFTVCMESLGPKNF